MAFAGEHGDVFDFVGRYQLGYDHAWNAREPALFMEAVCYLANRAGISIEEDADLRSSAAWSERQLVTRLRDALLDDPTLKHELMAYEMTRTSNGWSYGAAAGRT